MVVANAFMPSSGEAEAGRLSVNSRPSWSESRRNPVWKKKSSIPRTHEKVKE